MALDQSALLEVLEALTLADVDDRVRTATETLDQALIEAELAAAITLRKGLPAARRRSGLQAS
jgi:hypothetical protein